MSNSTTPIVYHINEKSAPLWFHDGDIVTIASLPEVNKTCWYRLHRDVLAVHAPVFLEFLDEELARKNILVNNTLAVRVPEDGNLLGLFLLALYHPSSLLRWKYNSECFKRVLPLYKMALKYKVNYITDVLSAQLEQDWPKNIWEWDAFESDDVMYMKGSMGVYLDMYPEPVAAIEFARVANLPSILPAAFYQLSRVSADNDYEGNTGLGITDSWKLSKRSARWPELSKEDFLTLATGKGQLSNFAVNFQRALTNEIPAEETKCLEAWRLMPAFKSDDILHDLEEICKPDKLPGAFMCENCRSGVNERARKAREGLWALLPHLFRLPGACAINLALD